MSSTRTWFADRALRGVSFEFVAICLGFMALANLFSLQIAFLYGLGRGTGDIAEMFVRLFLANVVRGTTVLLGIAAWNLGPRPLVARIVLTATAILGAAWLAVHAAKPIDDPVYAGIIDRSTLDYAVWIEDSVTALVVVAIIVLFMRDGDNLRALDRQRLRVLELDRGLAEARLRVTQAQIEPHFLFNTLANIRRLYDLDREGGRAMLRHFKGVLEHALPSMRQSVSTLGQEIAYATAYLNVQQIRMGRRLAFSFDVPGDLRETSFPPMMLLTLVENAVKHGLAPLPRGGTILVEARREDRVVCVRVIDDGRGFGTGTSGTGIGLANIEARLRAAFGSEGRLVLEQNPERGVTASIEVPA